MEVEDEIKLTDIAEEMIQNLHKQMDALKVSQLVVRYIHAHGEEQSSVTPVYHLVCSKLKHEK